MFLYKFCDNPLSGGLGMLGPLLGVGAAVAGGGTAAFIGQMMSGCPRSRPCRVRLTISSVNLFLIF